MASLGEFLGNLIDTIDRGLGLWDRRMNRQQSQYARLIAENQDHRHALLEDIQAKQRQLVKAAKQYEAAEGPRRDALKDQVDELTSSIELKREEREIIAENIGDLERLSATIRRMLLAKGTASRLDIENLKLERLRVMRRVNDRRAAIEGLPQRTLARRKEPMSQEVLSEDGRSVEPSKEKTALSKEQRELIAASEREIARRPLLEE
jgi:hypothetical protein